MLSYISAKEAAEKWNISQRRVAILCAEERIKGAMMVGNMWIIPSTAEKPIDKRTIRYEKQKVIELKPFVKWVGGKGQLIEQLEKYIPADGEKVLTKYAEPFVGGGALLFNILSKYNFESLYISDINEELINAYNVVKNKVDELVNKLTEMQLAFVPMDENGRKYYYYTARDRFNSLQITEETAVEKASLFIFLNKTCFNGLYRVNKKGQFNVPMGAYKTPTICDENNLRNVSEALQNVTIVCGDYTLSKDFIDKETFVYLDPPYRPISETAGFTAYNADCFDDKEQIMNSHIIGTPVGYMQMGAIDTEMIQEMLYEKAETYSLSTCRKIYFILDQMFSYAVRKEERYVSNPMEKVDNVTEKQVKQKPKDEPFLEESDMQKLIAEADRVNTLENRINGEVGTRVYGVNADLILMLLYTGARSEEGLALQFKDFIERDGKTLVYFQHVIKDIVLRDNEGKPVLNENGQKTYIQVDSPEMKSEGSKRFVPLNAEALELLNRIRNSRPDHKPTDYLFTTENGTLPDPKNVRRTLKNMLTRADCDVTEMGLHGLRRSFATYLINKDVPLVIISELLGHANVIITQKQYAKVLQAKKAEGIDLMQFKTAKEIPTVTKDVTANHNVISITDFHKEKRHIVL